MNSRVKNLLFWVVVGLFMILLFNLFSVPTHAPEDEVIFSDFMAKLDKGEVMKVTIKAQPHQRNFKGPKPDPDLHGRVS
jgi:cell division protease FtsH